MTDRTTRPADDGQGPGEAPCADRIYRSIYENNIDGIVLTDSQQGIFAINPAASRILGYGPQELIGRTIERLADPKTVAPAPPTGREHPLSDGSECLNLLRKNGSSFPAETSRSDFRIGTRDITALTFRDITDRRRAEQTFRENEAHLRILFENTTDIIALLNPDGTIRYHTPAAERLLGYTAEEFSRLVAFDLLHPDDRERIVAIFADALLKPGITVTATMRVRHRDDGTWRTLEGIGINLIDDPGARGFLLNARDVTEKQKIEEMILQDQKMQAIGTLAGGVAHEINNVLMGIQGYASLILRETGALDRHYDRLLHILQQVESGAALTQQLLGFARSGRYEIKPTDINALVRKTAEVFGRTKREIRIHEHLAENLWPVEADRSQIEQVLLNLYINAGQAMPTGGQIHIETGNAALDESSTKTHDVPPGAYVRISVSDTGVGMDEKTKARIFEPFFTTRELGRGKGLGLAVAYGIIRGHMGFITAYSEKGTGSRFSIYLPASAQKAVPDNPVPPETLQGLETILIVDDEPFIIDVTRDILESFGYEVLTAQSGAEAIRTYRTQGGSIDLVILDMIMPDMGGGDVFAGLKAINPAVRVILASGYSMNGHAQTIMEQGCRAFLQKPFSMTELSRKVREALEKDSGAAPRTQK
jgi:PAS domain S-box-containing protein